MKNIKTYRKVVPIILIILCPLSLFSGVDLYKIDSTHSSIEFSIRHFVAKTNGNFSNFEGFIEYNEDNLNDNYAEAKIYISSVDTKNVIVIYRNQIISIVQLIPLLNSNQLIGKKMIRTINLLLKAI